MSIFYPELIDLSPDQLAEAFEGQPPFGDDDEAIPYYLEIAASLAESGAFNYLESAVEGDDPHRVHAALKGLGEAPDDPRYEQKAVDLLTDPRPLVVSAAIDYLTGKRIGARLPEVMAVAAHPDPGVVGAALQYLAFVHPQAAGEHLRRALHHSDPRVRWRACDGLEEAGREADSEFVRPLLHDHDEDVRVKAAETIHALTGARTKHE